MRQIAVIIIATIISTANCAAQKKIAIKVGESKAQGVVFPKEYVLKFHLKNVIEKFTPNLRNLDSAEGFLITNRASIKYSGLNGSFAPDKLREKFKYYKRQYIGFINSDKDSVVLIQLLNFKKKNIAQQEFAGWESEFLVGFGGFFEGNTLRILVNLSKRQVGLY